VMSTDERLLLYWRSDRNTDEFMGLLRRIGGVMYNCILCLDGTINIIIEHNTDTTDRIVTEQLPCTLFPRQ
jgi:hypothetical protein